MIKEFKKLLSQIIRTALEQGITSEKILEGVLRMLEAD